MKRPRTLISVFRSVLALALVLWCAGTGCVIVGYARGSQAESEVAQQVEGNKSDPHACCKARHKALKQNAKAFRESLLVSQRSVTLPKHAPSRAMTCCPLTGGSMLIAARAHASDAAPVLIQSEWSGLNITSANPSPVAVPVRLPNQGHLYLISCAFLI